MRNNSSDDDLKALLERWNKPQEPETFEGLVTKLGPVLLLIALFLLVAK